MAVHQHIARAIHRGAAPPPAPVAPDPAAGDPSGLVNVLWGHSPEYWMAIGTFALTIATVALIVIGWVQISAIKRQNRRWQTLAAVDRYNYDPIMDGCLRKLRDAKNQNQFKDHEKDFRLEITTILNCLDGIALCINQGLYIEELVRDHLQNVVIEHASEYLDDGIPGKIEFEARDFPYLQALAARWTRLSRPRFRDSEWWFPWRRIE
jgi:hypothetical protein